MSCTQQSEKQTEGDTWNTCVSVTSESPAEMAGTYFRNRKSERLNYKRVFLLGLELCSYLYLL